MEAPTDTRERRIRRLISTFELAGIPTTREQAERAVDDAAKEPMPDFDTGVSVTEPGVALRDKMVREESYNHVVL